MSEHTKEPWELTKDFISIQAYPPGDVIRICLAPDHMWNGPDNPRWKANARRIVACVNLLANYSTEYLERIVAMGQLSSVEINPKEYEIR